jgi:MFS family permease
VRDLHGLSLYAWGFSSFLIANLLGTVLGGELSDRRGPVLPYYLGISTFTLGLFLAGSAPAMWLFVLARGVQGLGGGIIFVTLYVLIARSYAPAMRPRVFSLISSAWVVPALVGPALAGFVAEHAGWRWVFLGLPPLVVPAVLLMFGSLRHYGGPHGRDAAARPGRALPAAAVAGGAALLLFSGQRPNWASLAPLAAGLALLGIGLPRLLPPGALRLRPGLPATVVMRGLLTGAFFGTDAFIPLGLTVVRGLAVSEAGLALSGGAIGWSLGSWYQGRPGTSVPRHRLIRAGAILNAAGIALVMLSLWPPVSAWLAVPAWALGGLGMGLAMASLSVLTLEKSPPAEQGASSSALQVCDTLGSALSIGLGGVIVAAASAAGASIGLGISISDACMAALALVAITASRRLEAVEPNASA